MVPLAFVIRRIPSYWMPLDHFVSQVHLKRFFAPDLDRKKMYAFRKSDGHTFPCGAEDVCRLSEGSTNTYLPEPRLVEDFLKLIEPKYNAACAAITLYCSRRYRSRLSDRFEGTSPDWIVLE